MDNAPPRPGHLQPQPEAQADRQLALIGACYATLFVLGVAQGIVGSFHYSGGFAGIPGAAVGFAALILVTCVLAARGMRRPAAGLMPAVGWFAASFVLAMRTPGGSIVITNTTAGKWFLFGGALCAAVGVVASFTGLATARAPRRGELAPRRGALRSRKPRS